MPTPPLPAEVEQVLTRPNHAVMASCRPDGQPVSVATWYVYDAPRILMNLDAGRKRLEYLRQDPRVSLTVLDVDDWYTHVSVQGRVSELVDDPDLTDIDRIARHYTGSPYPVRDRARVSAWVDIEFWHGWGRLRDAG